MIDLSDVLAQPAAITWVKARVLSIEANGTITVSMNGGPVPQVEVLNGYAPAVGDLANCLIFEPIGMIAMGKSKPLTIPTPPVPGTPLVVTKLGVGSWDLAAKTWTDGLFLLKRGFQTAITYRHSTRRFGDLTFGEQVFGDDGLSRNTLAGGSVPLAAFEIEMQSLVAGGSTPTFVLHNNLSALPGDPPFAQLTAEFGPNVRVSDLTPTWIPLPVGWGEALTAGTALGVGLSAQVYSVPEATFTPASGSLRFTPLT